MDRCTSLWIVSREYAGFAEAGGVKNVVKALAETAYENDFCVTVFLPRYGSIQCPAAACTGSVQIPVGGDVHSVQFLEMNRNGIRFVFIDTLIFNEKKDIYTYCADEVAFFQQKLHKPELKKGDGYADSQEMNILFQKAVCCYGIQQHTAPQILHCHDAHTALIPVFLFYEKKTADIFCNTKAFITIHNAGDGYRQTIGSIETAAYLTGLPSEELECGLVDTVIEPFLLGAKYAKLTTVSPWYAEQLIQPSLSPYSYRFSCALAERGISIAGITNGIDFSAYNPAHPEVSELPYSFDIQHEDFTGKYACRSSLLRELEKTAQEQENNSAVQWFGQFHNKPTEQYVYVMYHGRLVYQKGIEVLLNAVPRILGRCTAIRFIVMGQGSPVLEQQAAHLAETFSGSFVYCKGYSRKTARLIAAASDFIVLPSLFEPCGLEDLIAQTYGTIPIAHAEGGLQKITHGKTGFLYTVSPDHKPEAYSTERHIEVLSNAVCQYAEQFLASGCRFLVDVPYFRSIILEAYQELQHTFSWRHIFPTYYAKLYYENY
ncbi:MAG: glycogen/starch synthase [Treponema sp.]